MIQFTDNHNCCGCSACAQKCPAHCISMKENEEGFLYPEVNADLCVNCDLCKTICPALNVEAERTPIKCYAITGSNDEIVMKSSSVGLFSLLAEYVIKNNGVVFGASFDSKWGVQHTYTEDIDGLVQFRGSKYVQSRIGNCYYKAEEFLKANRIVLFSGTACQILGLKRYLKRDYPNLFALMLYVMVFLALVFGTSICVHSFRQREEQIRFHLHCIHNSRKLKLFALRTSLLEIKD